MNRIVSLFEGPFTVAGGGKVTDQHGNIVGKLASDSDLQDLIGKNVTGIDNCGNLLADNGSVVGKVDIAPEGSIAERIKEAVPEAAQEDVELPISPVEEKLNTPDILGEEGQSTAPGMAEAESISTTSPLYQLKPTSAFLKPTPSQFGILVLEQQLVPLT